MSQHKMLDNKQIKNITAAAERAFDAVSSEAHQTDRLRFGLAAVSVYAGYENHPQERVFWGMIGGDRESGMLAQADACATANLNGIGFGVGMAGQPSEEFISDFIGRMTKHMEQRLGTKH